MDTILEVSLTGFQPPELSMLYQLLSYNRDDLLEAREEMNTLSDLLPSPHLKDTRYTSSEGLRSLLRRIWFVSFLVQQLEAVLNHQVPLDRAIDLSQLPDPHAFQGYLESELRRNELGARYTQGTYNAQTRQRLLDAFSIEYRFLSLLCHHLE